MDNRSGKLVVVTGYSGAGKDTLIDLFLQKRNDFETVITHSTRPQRPDEIHGVHHHFVNKNEFKLLIKEGKMLEYVKYGSFYKGTSKMEFEKIISGKNLIWRVDILRAALYEETILGAFDQHIAHQIISNSLRIFIKTPSYRVGFNRYFRREHGKADMLEFQKRFLRDVEVYRKYKDRFFNVILNKTGKAAQSATEFERVIDFHLKH